MSPEWPMLCTTRISTTDAENQKEVTQGSGLELQDDEEEIQAKASELQNQRQGIQGRGLQLHDEEEDPQERGSHPAEDKYLQVEGSLDLLHSRSTRELLESFHSSPDVQSSRNCESDDDLFCNHDKSHTWGSAEKDESHDEPEVCVGQLYRRSTGSFLYPANLFHLIFSTHLLGFVTFGRLKDRRFWLLQPIRIDQLPRHHSIPQSAFLSIHCM